MAELRTVEIPHMVSPGEVLAALRQEKEQEVSRLRIRTNKALHKGFRKNYEVLVRADDVSAKTVDQVAAKASQAGWPVEIQRRQFPSDDPGSSSTSVTAICLRFVLPEAP